MMRTLNRICFWLKSRVMSINNARIVAHPNSNLVKTAPVTDVQAGESPPHGVGSHPVKTGQLGVLLERSGEIVTVTILTMPYGRLEHEWLACPIMFKELKKTLRKWNRAFLPIFKVDRRSFPQVKQPGPYIEPEWPRLNDLVLP
jgi:hypothetical protein